MDATLWVAVATAIFAIIVFKPVKRVITRGLDEKIIQIKNNLEEARKLKEEAQAILVDAQKRVSQSEEDVKSIIDNAEKEAENIITTTQAKLENDIELRKQLAIRKIEAYEVEAVNQAKEKIANITISATQSILEEKLSQAGSNSDIKNSIANIEKTLH